MKQVNCYRRAVQYLTKIFKLVNEEYFEGCLEEPTITIQTTLGAYGHVSTAKVWETEQGISSYELNVSADYMKRPIENIVATLIHEACHLYAMQNGIQDTSNRGIYHNKRFKELAETRGLIIRKHEKYGWTITEPSEKTIEFCLAYDLQEILVSRNTGVFSGGLDGGKDNTGKPVIKKGNSQKWICPCCGAIIRSTCKLNVICGDCDKKFVRA